MKNSEKRTDHTFPLIRPSVEIVKSEATIGEVDSVELRWWFEIPRLGDHTMWANYDADTLELAWVTDMEAKMPASIRGIDGVEVRVDEWSVESGLKADSHVFYARVEDAGESRWVAVVKRSGGKMELYTVFDDDFEYQWGRV